MNGGTPTRSPEEILGLEAVDYAALFADPARRAAHEERLRHAYRRRPRAELVEAFHQAGLGAEAVTPMSAVFSHLQFVANGMAATVEDPELGPTTQVGLPAVLVGTPGAIRGGQPKVGEHSREVLSDAGYAEGEIDGLIAAGVVAGVAPWAR
jgi:crotonobetainyl-CoA:carnitine CoA-transferase CaiB-like acyl-CoA transferase